MPQMLIPFPNLPTHSFMHNVGAGSLFNKLYDVPCFQLHKNIEAESMSHKGTSPRWPYL